WLIDFGAALDKLHVHLARELIYRQVREPARRRYVGREYLPVKRRQVLTGARCAGDEPFGAVVFALCRLQRLRGAFCTTAHVRRRLAKRTHPEDVCGGIQDEADGNRDDEPPFRDE